MEELEPRGTAFAVAESIRADGTPVLTLRGELDISSVDILRRSVDAVLARRPDAVDFEVADLTFLDSSGIAVLVHTANNVRAVELHGATTIVRRVIEATGLAEILRLDPP